MRRFLLLCCLTVCITVNGQVRSGTTYQSIIDVSPEVAVLTKLVKYK